MKKGICLFWVILLLFVLFLACDTSDSLKDEDGNTLATPLFVSGPTYGTYYPFANGLIKAAEETMGIFMDNVPTQGSLENADRLVYNEAYMGLVQEDVFRFAQETYQAQYYSNPATAQKKYLKIASQLRVLMAAYNEDLHFLVNSNSVTAASDTNGDGTIDKYDITLDDIKSSTNLLEINYGSTGSGTYITASTVMNAHSFTVKPLEHTDDAATGIQKVISGAYDGAFFVTAAPSALFEDIDANSPVVLVSVQMPSGNKLYEERGTIDEAGYLFQVKPVTNNITVKSLIAVGPLFNDRGVELFIKYLFANSQKFVDYSQKWADVSQNFSFDFMKKNPELVNYKAFCTLTNAPILTKDTLEPYFYSGTSDLYRDLSTELVWLLSHNLDVDLKDYPSTGSRESAIRMMDGNASMAIIQADLFSFFKDKQDIFESMKIASMKKVMPLHYEYLHLLVRSNPPLYTTDFIDTHNESNAQTPDGKLTVHDFPGKTINIGPKTSNTFLSALSVIKSYGFNQDSSILYSHDDPSDGVIEVINGNYDAAFVLSGVPFERFYSHDTWDITIKLANSDLIPVTFNSTIDVPYETGYLNAGNTILYANYPYSLPDVFDTNNPPTNNKLQTVRVRTFLVMSAAMDDSRIATYIKSIYRKSYYKTNPPDGDWTDFDADPVWASIVKEDVAVDISKGIFDDYKGAKDYFVRDPYGYSKEAAKYFVSLFPGE